MRILQKNKRAYVFILTGFLYLISCNAPRENPFDPLAENYQRPPSQKSIESFKFYSSFDNFYNQTYLFFEASIISSENNHDISHVILKCVEKSFHDTLNQKEDEYTIYQTDFNISSISADIKPIEIPELNFELVVKTANGDSSLFGPYIIRRVIEQKLTQLSPVQNSTISDTIEFSWEKVELDYFFTHNIRLFQFHGNVELIHVFSNIPADSTHYLFPGLPDGTYLWELQVEDRIGNICQSNAILFFYVN